jgi:hypothetical protein
LGCPSWQRPVHPLLQPVASPRLKTDSDEFELIA